MQRDLKLTQNDATALGYGASTGPGTDPTGAIWDLFGSHFVIHSGSTCVVTAADRSPILYSGYQEWNQMICFLQEVQDNKSIIYKTQNHEPPGSWPALDLKTPPLRRIDTQKKNPEVYTSAPNQSGLTTLAGRPKCSNSDRQITKTTKSNTTN